MKKSDVQVKRNVLAALAYEPSVDATFIDIKVRFGVVALSGVVGSYTEKWMARQAIERVRGVNGLVGEVGVKLTNAGLRSDADIACLATCGSGLLLADTEPTAASLIEQGQHDGSYDF